MCGALCVFRLCVRWLCVANFQADGVTAMLRRRKRRPDDIAVDELVHDRAKLDHYWEWPGLRGARRTRNRTCCGDAAPKADPCSLFLLFPSPFLLFSFFSCSLFSFRSLVPRSCAKSPSLDVSFRFSVALGGACFAISQDRLQPQWCREPRGTQQVHHRRPWLREVSAACHSYIRTSARRRLYICSPPCVHLHGAIYMCIEPIAKRACDMPLRCPRRYLHDATRKVCNAIGALLISPDCAGYQK